MVAARRLRQWRVRDALRCQPLCRDEGDLVGMRPQSIGIHTPIGLDLAGKMRQRIGLDAHAWYAELLALDQRGARAAEGVQHAVALIQAELA